MHLLLALPARQSQTAESRAGSDNAGPGEPSRLLGGGVLQESFAALLRQISQQQMKPLRLFAVCDLLMTRENHLHPLVVLPLHRPSVSRSLWGRKESHLQGQSSVTLASLVSVLCPSKVYLLVVVSRRHFPYPSCATTSERSTLVDQPRIMLRSVSHPSAKTRITCGTTNWM